MASFSVTSRMLPAVFLAFRLLPGCGSATTCQSGAEYGTQCYDADGVRTSGCDGRAGEPEPKPIEPDYVRD